MENVVKFFKQSRNSVNNAKNNILILLFRIMERNLISIYDDARQYIQLIWNL